MVSDVLSEAVERIDDYLNGRPSLYDGDIRQMIVRVRNHMEQVVADLDKPPENEA